MEIQQGRPVYVEFEQRAVEDRAASLSQGHFVGRDEDWAVITPSGGNLVVEKPAEDWLKEKERIEDTHVQLYRQAYEAWKKGQEIPLDGTAIRDWPPLSPAQAKLLQSLNIRTVEDLATAPDPALGKIGMGARALQTKAQAWLNSAEDKGKVAEQIAALTVKLESLEKSLEDKTADNERLKAQLEKPRKAKAA